MTGELRWPIVSRFRRYVEGLPDGDVRIADVTVTADGFLFPLVDSCGDSMAFKGQVEFIGHGGLLQVVVANPAISLENDKAILTIDDTFEATPGRLLFATSTYSIASTGDVRTVTLTKPRLADDACDLFNGQYASGSVTDLAVARLCRMDRGTS